MIPKAISVLMVAIAIGACTPSPKPPPEKDAPLITEVPSVKFVQTTANQGPVSDKYKRTLVSAAHMVWGLDAPIATFAGQVHQESGWREDVVSSAGAQGIGQFMPSTANWIDDVYPEELGPAQPMNPSWALKALVRYDKHLSERITAANECENAAFFLAAYNGGLGWVYRDQAMADSNGVDKTRYWGATERFNAGRNASAFTENRGYPKRIIGTLQSRYATWGRMVCVTL